MPLPDVAVTDIRTRKEVILFVPLAEVNDSEQAPWGAARREVSANDQDSLDTLIAVTAASNRSKADEAPAEWLPSGASYHCACAAIRVGTKPRRGPGRRRGGARRPPPFCSLSDWAGSSGLRKVRAGEAEPIRLTV
ncbi:hypothetical protein AB0O18_30185 [Streptomyces sp. NPDC093224]|uniref:hypothetical protein n=1 Tax=Streptomyces sp. NPDC093224 TaxID=3155198 RepID=UPI0034364B4C